ncbi:MAG TPA: putative glycoside hydrolase [Clostridiales bacterium]|nr:putative glycoside hydrolase [Clostridiales bacterium]
MRQNIFKGLIAGIVLVLIIASSVGAFNYFKNKNHALPKNNLDNAGENNISGSNNNKSDKSSEIAHDSTGNKSDSGSKEEIPSTDENEMDNINTPYAPKIKKPNAVKALYLTGWTAGESARLNKFIALSQQSEINSLVVDIKDDDGLVGYETNIPAVKEINGWTRKYNVDKVINTLHENDIYVIGRLVCFKDPVLSSKRADLAVKHASGGLWKDNNSKTWLDPYNRDSWTYLIDIAKEALDKGFDEIQFDYIRFPNDGNKKAMVFNSGDIKKYEIINEFLSFAKKELPGAIISADVFGIICESPEDTEDIGQYLELVGKDIDSISPMAYPSHYAFGQIVNNVKFAKPDLEPYAVVYNTLLKAKNRISSVENYKSNIRPYLQGFTAPWLRSGNYQSYGAKQIREQIKAVYDAGFTEWIIWDPSNKYPADAFDGKVN